MNRKHFLYVILLMAFLLRLLLPLSAYFMHGDINAFLADDSGGYINLAKNLLYDHSFTGWRGVEISRTPLYPMFIIPALLLKSEIAFTVLLQIIVSTMTVFIVFLIAQRLFNNRMVAYCSSAIYSVEPLSILYSSEVLSETLFGFMLVTSLYYFISFFSEPDLKNVIGTSLFLVLSYFVRPVSMYLPFVYASFILLKILLSSDKKKLVLFLLLFLFLSVTPRYIWQYRNHRLTGTNQFSIIAIKNIYFYKAAAINARKKGIPYYKEQKAMGYHNDDIYFSVHPDQKLWPRSKVIAYWYDEGKRVIIDNWLVYARIHFDGMLRILLDPGATEFLKVYNKYPGSGGLLGVLVDKGIFYTIKHLYTKMPDVFLANLIIGLLNLMLLMLFVFFVTAKRNWNNPLFYFLLIIVGYLWFLSAGPAALNRFRHPIMPLICVGAGNSLYYILQRIKPANV